MRPLGKSFFARDVDVVARALIGTVLTFGRCGGAIVETESYDIDDPASHAYRARRTPRNAVMFGPPGHAYVYRIYGMHWCLNFVCRNASAVLIRALEPREGLAAMRRRRDADAITALCSGPGKLCDALAITGAHNGLSLYDPPFALHRGDKPAGIDVGLRIGLTKGVDAPRRYGLAGSPFLSKRFPAQAVSRAVQ